MELSPERLNSVTQRLVCTAIILCLLYFGRDILMPTVVAIVLSFGLMPLVRRLQRLGLNRIVSVVAVVVLTCLLLGNVMLNMGLELVRIAESLPRYELNIRNKFAALDDLTFGRLKVVLAKADGVIGGLNKADQAASAASGRGKYDGAEVMTVRIEETPPTPKTVIAQAISSMIHFVEIAGLALIVLIFVLIDYEVLRDRLIRLIGGRNLRDTTTALNDAGDKLMRYFGAQIAVNALCGTVVGLSLHWFGVPEATFLGALTAISRFIPYVGVWIAMATAFLISAAVFPGWTLTLATLGVFLAVEVSVSQIIEPKFYGHTTGLSPLSVVIGAIFWAGLWGPAGLVLATPLTLVLVVAGRHVQSLRFIELLLGDVPGLSAAERFYQRALAGDTRELATNLQQFLRKRPAAEYCDHVLLPFVALAKEDFSQRDITETEFMKLTQTITTVLRLLEQPARRAARRRALSRPPAGTVLVISRKDPVDEMYAKFALSLFKSNGVTAMLAQPDEQGAEPLELGEEVRTLVFAAADSGDAAAQWVSQFRERATANGRLKCYAFLPDLGAPHGASQHLGYAKLLHSYRDVQSICDELCIDAVPVRP